MKRKAVRAITGLLCAALSLSNMTGIRAFAMEDAGQGMRMQEYSLEDDTQEEEDEKAEETEQADSDDEPETEAQEGDTDSNDEEQEEDERGKEKSEEEAETGSEEEAEETVPEDTVEEPLDGETVETVSENTVEEAPDADDISVRVSFFPQVYSPGKSFTVDGKTYNSMDTDETYLAGDDITAYYFEADSLLYFDGTGR